jgi:hypothetical protein
MRCGRPVSGQGFNCTGITCSCEGDSCNDMLGAGVCGDTCNAYGCGCFRL